ncbi:hypothetical protein L218DRAFT_380604 [Marasmius fiardii PR-910]|nr:hypothetical protein L218DRAFT_380604 [Marasmius fiardii PR-910]
MPDPLPYNISISSQTASIIYIPARDTSIDAGWNSTYSAGAKDTGYGRDQGLGADSHRTSRSGASLEFSWVGTAVYLYGNAAAGSYGISVDNQDIGVASDEAVPQGGLLGSKTGLQYGNHTVKLLARGLGEVGFQYAQATIGVGYSGTTVQNRTIMTVDEQPGKPQANPFFRFDIQPDANSWRPEDLRKTLFENGSVATVPRHMITNLEGDKVTFTISQASAFFLYGSMNYDHGIKQAAIYSSKEGEANARRSIVDDGSNYLDFEQIIYWQSGLDPGENYTVQMINAKPLGAFGINKLDIIFGGYKPESAGNPAFSRTGLAAGTVAGIVIGCVTALGLVLGGFLSWRRSKRQLTESNNHRYESTWTAPMSTYPTGLTSHNRVEYSAHNDSTSMVILSYDPFGTQTPRTPPQSLRATDGGPVQQALLPPEYQTTWVTDSTQSLLAAPQSPRSQATESESGSDGTGAGSGFHSSSDAATFLENRKRGFQPANETGQDQPSTFRADRKR